MSLFNIINTILPMELTEIIDKNTHEMYYSKCMDKITSTSAEFQFRKYLSLTNSKRLIKSLFTFQGPKILFFYGTEGCRKINTLIRLIKDNFFPNTKYIQNGIINRDPLWIIKSGNTQQEIQEYIRYSYTMGYSFELYIFPSVF